jgi:glycosyltransferase involved in cell wall biosynthesis
MNKLSIIVPCYNEEECIEIFYNAVMDQIEAIGCGYEILYIDDGSKDLTLQKIEELAEKDGNVKYISLSRNFGKEAAMYAGFCNASGDYVVVMDADLQHPPELLPKMYQILEEGAYDSVATKRVNRKGEHIVRSFFSNIFYSLINTISETEIVKGSNDYRMMNRDMVDTIVKMCEYNRFTKGIFGWIGFNTYWLEFENVGRAAGTTTWNARKLFQYSVDGVMNFSKAPLTLASASGFLLTILSAILLVFIVVRKLVYGDPVQGWASTVCIIIFLGGVVLFCLGIMGEYIARIYMEVKHRPHYVVSGTNKDDVKKVM